MMSKSAKVAGYVAKQLIQAKGITLHLLARIIAWSPALVEIKFF
jgi:hypothetical protein